MKRLRLILLFISVFFSISYATVSSSDTGAVQEEVIDDDIAKLLAEEEKNQAVADTMPTTSEEVKEFSDYGIFGTPLTDCSQREDKLSIWTAFGFGILGGMAALFFPCTFPMIPMTMSFFLKGSGDKAKGKKNAILYGFCIFLVYFLLSLPFNFGLLGGDALSNFSTNIPVNLIFFIIFIIFAFSLFGFYDISMPSSIANKLDSKSNAGDFIGIFFMAFTLAIVSFSCTGPILGLVLGNLNNVKYVTPAFSGFGIGLGVPFALFALFPQLLKNLPKSGSWLDVMKTIFGFIELAFAFKFLSNADLVGQWGLLKREIFIVIWVLVFFIQGLYLVGKFRFKKGSEVKKTPITWGLALASFLFVGYLLTDFFGGSLRLIDGFPPPKFYAIMGGHQTQEKEGSNMTSHSSSNTAHHFEFETNENKYQEALEKAKKQNKLLMIDFTGWACVNCRRMEGSVWTDPAVSDLLKNKFVVTSLYVDQKTDLPKNQQYYSNVLKKEIITVGDKWTDMQGSNLHEFTQPQYAIIDPQTARIVNKPMSGYNPVDDFKAFLECALTYNP